MEFRLASSHQCASSMTPPRSFARRSTFRSFAPSTFWPKPMRTSLVMDSVDPLSSRTVYEPGHVLTIHSRSSLQSFLDDYKQSLVVLMCKSSHCKPCKAFMQTYHGLARRFQDYLLLDIVGDESPETRKMMVDWKVKATPTFLLHRNGEVVETISGTGSNRLLKALLKHLKEGERGKEWDEEPMSIEGTRSSDDE